MREIINPANQKTTYTIDGMGRRMNEKIFDSNGTLLKQTDFAYSTNFPGVVTETIVRNFDGNGGGHDIKTTSVLDNKGRVVESISYPGNGQPTLSTTTVYDLANNKRAVYDPLGQVTVFDYDARNRLSKVTHHDNSFKEMTYDPGGNLITARDENGNVTDLPIRHHEPAEDHHVEHRKRTAPHHGDQLQCPRVTHHGAEPQRRGHRNRIR